MLKPSIYTLSVLPKNLPYFLLYHRLSNEIARVPLFLSNYFQGTIFSPPTAETTAEILNQLLHAGYLVEAEVDEEALGRMKYYDSIYNRTLSVTILVSEECNFRCKYCYESFQRGNMENWVADAFVRYLRKSLARYGGLNLEWFGGEPLLAPDTVEKISFAAIELCKQTGLPFRAGITTNGYLLTPEMMKRMLKCRIRSFSITIDGIETCHDQTRQLRNGGSTFQRIFSNLKKIKEEIRSGTFEILIRTNVTQSLLPHLNEYIDLLQREFGEDSRFSFYFRPAGNWGGDQVEQIRHNFVATLEDVFQHLVQSTTALNMDGNVHLLANKRCDAANRNNFILGSDGKIYKCTMLLDAPYNQLGHISPSGALKINQDLLAKWVAPAERQEAQCKECSHWELCHNRYCAARVFRQVEFNKIHCGYEENTIASILLLLDKANSKKIHQYGKIEKMEESYANS